MPTKLRFSTDNSNRLIASKDGREDRIEGGFTVEENDLFFEPSRKSVFAGELGLSRKRKFEGNWRLTENKDLKLVLAQTRDQAKGDELLLNGRIISTEADAVVFQMHCVKEPDIDRVELLRLNGRWQADECNQLNFLVGRDFGEDRLKFAGSWEVDDCQQILYAYERQDLIRKTKSREEIAFKGYWNIDSDNRLAYILDLENRSFFEFRAQMESPTLVGRVGQIRYRIGAGAKELAKERVLLLFGKWKLSRAGGVSFEMEYGRGRAVTFGADVYLSRDKEFVFELKSGAGRKLGFSVRFDKKVFRSDAVVYARLAKLERQLEAEAGLKLRW